MNELLGWYGYDKVDSRDTQGLNLNRFTSSTSEAGTDENSKTISDCLHVEVNGNSDDSSDRVDGRNESPTFGGSASGTGRTSRSPPPQSRASPTNLPTGYVICAWCQKVGMRLFTLRSSNGTKAFCSEICFTQCRRASFKKYKVCDWCKHIRHTVNYVDFKDGEQQLQFCSDKCLNQYKMNIFCKETQAHLQMHPHLHHQDRGTLGGSSSVSSSPSPSCPNGSESALTLITPDLWLRNCKEPESIDLEHSVEDEGDPMSLGDVGYRSDNDSDGILARNADETLPGATNHHEGKENGSSSRQPPKVEQHNSSSRKHCRFRERRRHRHQSNGGGDANKMAASSPRHQHHYHRRSHRLEARRVIENGGKMGNGVRRSTRTFKTTNNHCKGHDVATTSSGKDVGSNSLSMIDKTPNPSPTSLAKCVLHASVPTTTTNASSAAALFHIPPPPPTLQAPSSTAASQQRPPSSPPVAALGSNVNQRPPPPMFFPRPAQPAPPNELFRMPPFMHLPRHPHAPFRFPQGMQFPAPSLQMPNVQPSPAQGLPQRLPMPNVNPHQQPQYGHFLPPQSPPNGSMLPPVTVMVPYPVFVPVPIPIPIPIPIPFPMGFKGKPADGAEGISSGIARSPCDTTENAPNCNGADNNSSTTDDSQRLRTILEQNTTKKSSHLVTARLASGSKVAHIHPEESGSSRTPSTSSDVVKITAAEEETLSSRVLVPKIRDLGAQVKQEPASPSSAVLLDDGFEEQSLPKDMLDMKDSSWDCFSLMEEEDDESVSNSEPDADSEKEITLRKSDVKDGGGNGIVYCDGLQVPSSPTSRLRHRLRLQVKFFKVNQKRKRKS